MFLSKFLKIPTKSQLLVGSTKEIFTTSIYVNNFRPVTLNFKNLKNFRFLSFKTRKWSFTPKTEKKKSSKEKAKSETLPPFSEGRYPKDGRDIFGPWTKVEEQALRQGVEKYGVGHWNEIIKRGAFAKDKTKPGIAHYYYHVISREKTPPWTKEEDQRLIKLVAEKRGKWKEFADILRRPLPEVYNRFNNFLIPGGKFGKWTDEENRELLVAVRKYGENWEKVKECLPSRTLLAIKEHYQDSPLFKLHRNYHKWKMLTPDHLDKRRNRIFEIIPR